MSAIIRDAFKVKTLLSFIGTLETNSLYLGIGRPYTWGASNDINVPVPTNTIQNIINDGEDFFAMKRITTADAIAGFVKESWMPNVKYDTYRHDWDGSKAAVYNGTNTSASTPKSIAEVKCVVVTPSYNVYMCIKHASIVATGEVLPSLYDPDTGVAIGTNTTIVKTADGYYWKFIGGTSAADLLKFSNKYYHPVKTIASAPAPADPYYNQWLAQTYSESHKSGIYCINVVSKGSGYSWNGIDTGAGTRVVTNAETDTGFKVIGDGVGLQFNVLYGVGGAIEDIEITNPGSGYTHATVVAATGLGLVCDIILTSTTGLGANPVFDLVARYLIINSQLVGADGSGDFTISNDYRKISLVYNPSTFGSNTIATASTVDAAITLNLQTNLLTTSYLPDAIVTGATSLAKARVIDWDSTTGKLRVIRTASENAGNTGANNNFQAAEAINTTLGTGGGSVQTIVTPEVDVKSGDILYSEYRQPINRQTGQTESLSIVLKF